MGDDDAKSIVSNVCSMLNALSIETEVLSSIRPAPLGGSEAQTVVFFTSCYNERAAVSTMLDRVLSKTALSAGRISTPPSHIVCVSALGTTKPNMNAFGVLFGGNNQLAKKREMEEALVSKCRIIGFDYTIVKIGKLKKVANPFELMPGDTLTQDIDVDTASQVLLQSIAYQYAARNTTFSVSGTASNDMDWDDLFLKLDGPELLRIPIDANSQLLYYLQDWAKTYFVDKKSGLTT